MSLPLPFGALLALSLVLSSGCASIPEPRGAATDEAAQALFDATAEAHGRAAFESLQDIAVSYDGQWYALIQKIQAALVDPEYRKRSEERLLLGPDVLAQVHTGPAGQKTVLRAVENDPDAPAAVLAAPAGATAPAGTGTAEGEGVVNGTVSVRYDGEPDDDPTVQDAAALVADAYRMFLLGPLHFIGRDARMERLSPVMFDGALTDRLRVRTRPGLGNSAQDDYVLYIDRDERLTRRIRFSLGGLASTRGAIVETDFFDHIERDGLRVATRFFERVRRPIPRLRAHRWRMTGLDLNRGMTRAELAGNTFTGAAASPAQPLGPPR